MTSYEGKRGQKVAWYILTQKNESIVNFIWKTLPKNSIANQILADKLKAMGVIS